MYTFFVEANVQQWGSYDPLENRVEASLDYGQFMARVQEYGGLPGEDSLRIAEAVLETLGERLSKKHREHLAAQLSKELKPFVLKHSRTERTKKS